MVSNVFSPLHCFIETVSALLLWSLFTTTELPSGSQSPLSFMRTIPTIHVGTVHPVLIILSCDSEFRCFTQITFPSPSSSLSWPHWFLDQYHWRGAVSLQVLTSFQFIAYGCAVCLPGSHFLKRQSNLSSIHHFSPLSQVLSVLYCPLAPIIGLNGSCPSCIWRKQIFPPHSTGTGE